MQETTTQASEKPQVVAVRKSRTDPNAFYVNALKDAGGFHRQSFFIEMAVCLAFYAEHHTAALPARKALRPLYERAGHDCKDQEGEDYKTVARRIGAAAELYRHLEDDNTLTEWIEGHTGQKIISAIVQELEKRQLNSIDAVKKAVGKASARPHKVPSVPPVQQPTLTSDEAADQAVAVLVGSNMEMQRAVRLAATPVPSERVLQTEHIVCTIPLEATSDEVKQLALMLLEFSTKMSVPVPVTV